MPRVIFVLFVAAGVLSAIYMVSTIVSSRPDRPTWWDNWFYILLELIPAALLGVRVIIDQRERVAWGLFAFGLFCIPLGDIVFAAFVEVQRSEVVLVAYLCYLAFYVLVLASLVMLLRKRLPPARATVWLDGLIACVGLLAAGTAIMLAPLTDLARDLDEIIAAISYPVGMLVLVAILLGAVTVLGRRPSRVWWFMTTAFSAMSVANAFVVVDVATETVVRGSFADSVWPPALLLLALAGWKSGSPPRPAAPVQSVISLVVPAVAISCALGVLIADEYSDRPAISVWLAFATIILGTGRLVLAVGDAVRSTRHEIELGQSLQAARDAAVAATDAKSEFLAIMSHELRTPLTAVIGMSELILETDLTTEQREYAETIDSGGNLLLAVINNVLDYSKIQAGALELEQRTFELALTLHAAVDLLHGIAAAKGLTVSCDIDPRCPQRLVGDANRLSQVVVNLTSNGLKFTENGGVAITVVPAEPGPTPGSVRLRFEVTDSGIGIPQDRMERLFTPFVQADSSVTRRFGGTGLGLMISRQIVEAMRGAVTVRSTVGVGSTFSFDAEFSAAPVGDWEPSPPPATTGVAAGRADDRWVDSTKGGPCLTILLADDTAVNRQVGQMMISRLGHTVDIVSDGIAVVEAVLRSDYDVVLMDVHMPLMDGLEATRRIRRLPPPFRQPLIVALTASASAVDRVACADVGMDDYMNKPLRRPELAAGLHTWSSRLLDRNVLTSVHRRTT
jgi:signal transduction histidine kinase/CheY-like chemotaxis protein